MQSSGQGLSNSGACDRIVAQEKDKILIQRGLPVDKKLIKMLLFPNFMHSLSFTVVSTTADSLHDKAVVLGDTIKETSFTIVVPMLSRDFVKPHCFLNYVCECVYECV
jgi:hypothetical protein